MDEALPLDIKLWYANVFRDLQITKESTDMFDLIIWDLEQDSNNA